jgi:hypothetical protein
MTGHRPFSELTKGFTPERRARVAAKAAQLREAMTLEELRKARDLSQEEVAASLAVGQPAVAKLEKRADMHVNNLEVSARSVTFCTASWTNSERRQALPPRRQCGGGRTARGYGCPAIDPLTVDPRSVRKQSLTTVNRTG